MNLPQNLPRRRGPSSSPTMSLDMTYLYPKVHELNEEPTVSETNEGFELCGRLLHCCDEPEPELVSDELAHPRPLISKGHQRTKSMFDTNNLVKSSQRRSNSLGEYQFLQKRGSDLTSTECDDVANFHAATGSSLEPPFETSFTKRYVLTRRIFRCEKSRVWECIEWKSGNRYCVKIFDIRSRSNMQAALREASFLREAQGNDIVLQLHETVLEHNKLFIVTELVEGTNLLTKVVQDGRLSDDQTKKVVASLLEGVEYLRKLRIAHNGLEPSNIMVTLDNSVKICDFGSASYIGEHAPISAESSPYLAPERTPEATSDVWSSGMILFFCLHGMEPVDFQSRRRVFFPNEFCPRAAKQLISSCANADPAVRLTALEALSHPFLATSRSDTQPMSSRSARWISCLSFLRKSGACKRQHRRLPSENTVDTFDSTELTSGTRY